jgi:hypothetical protein
VVANGSYQLLWYCDVVGCGYRTTPVPQMLPGVPAIAAVPITEDFRGIVGRCSVRGCDNEDVEWQHWFPQAIDGELAARFPQGYLCREHHEEWGHRVTPTLNPPRRGR